MIDKNEEREEETRGIFGYRVSGRPIQYAGPMKPNVDRAETIRRGWQRENVSRNRSVVNVQPRWGSFNAEDSLLREEDNFQTIRARKSYDRLPSLTVYLERTKHNRIFV